MRKTHLQPCVWLYHVIYTLTDEVSCGNIMTTENIPRKVHVYVLMNWTCTFTDSPIIHSQIHLPIHLPTHPTTHLSTHLPIYLLIHSSSNVFIQALSHPSTHSPCPFVLSIQSKHNHAHHQLLTRNRRKKIPKLWCKWFLDNTFSTAWPLPTLAPRIPYWVDQAWTLPSYNLQSKWIPRRPSVHVRHHFLV